MDCIKTLKLYHLPGVLQMDLACSRNQLFSY